MSSRTSCDVLSPRASQARRTSADQGLAEPLLTRLDSFDGGSHAGKGEGVAELKRLVRLAGPLVVQNLFGYLLSVVSAAFIGHLNDPVALSSAVLAGSFYNITGYSLVIGLSAGMETLCGQAYGARNYPMLGLVLQRALLICWAACIPIALFWSQAHHLLALLHQQPEIVAGASRYLAIATPALFLSSVSSCLYRYLVTQQEVRPSTICTIITSALCPLYNWLLVYRFRMGLDGAAWAFVASTGTYTLLLTIYTIVRDWLRIRRKSETLTWAGLSWRAWEGWGSYLRFAAPAAGMICLEWWMFEVVVLMAGSLGEFADVAVAVMGLSFHITSWTYMIPMSIGTAANTRVSNMLGSGNAHGARLAARTAVASGLCLQLGIAVFLYTGRHTVVRLFTSQHDIVYHVGRIMPVLAFSAVGDGLIAVMGGVLRGSGRQSLGAILNLVGYWCVGCPAALLFGFHLKLDVLGFWMGLASATSSQAVVLAAVMSRFDWDAEVARAAKLCAEQAAHESNRGHPRSRQPAQAQAQAQQGEGDEEDLCAGLLALEGGKEGRGLGNIGEEEGAGASGGKAKGGGGAAVVAAAATAAAVAAETAPLLLSNGGERDVEAPEER